MKNTKNYFFELENFVDANKDAETFKKYLTDHYNDENFCKLLSCAGFIPDLYSNDSSEETLFSKLVEILVAEWAERMGFNSRVLKTKSSCEDIDISLNGKIIVCDAKSFRLGRSQQAPNVKDFLKPADIKKWLSRHKNGLGGLITYPDTHDWTKTSDVYLYCTDKSCPTVILSYIYLAVLLHFRDKYSTNDLKSLWDYEKLFPIPLKKNIKGGNKIAYWNVIDEKMISILGITRAEFKFYFEQCKALQIQCIEKIIDRLRENKNQIAAKIKSECEKLSIENLRREFAEYKIKNETQKIDAFIKRIIEFRLNGKVKI